MDRLTSDEINQFLQCGTDSVQGQLASLLQPEHVRSISEDQRVVWRRSTLGDAHLYDDHVGLVHVLERPRLEKGVESRRDGTDIHTTGVALPGSKLSSSSYSLIVPRKPLLLMRTNFLCAYDIDVIVSNVNHVLASFVDVSCEFNTESFTWQALYLRGSSQSKLQVSIYCDDKNDSSYIIEVCRLSGDSDGCRLVFAQLKRTLGQQTIENHKPPHAHSHTLDLFATTSALDVLSDAETFELLQPLVKMARDPRVDSRVQAAKIMCDMSTNEAVQQVLCDSECLTALIELMGVDSPLEARQHALVALAQLSVPIACQEVMIDAGVVPVLLNLQVDSSYETAELKREVVRILANLAMRFGSKVVAAAGQGAITSWMEGIRDINDGRLKLHAERAFEALHGLIETA